VRSKQSGKNDAAGECLQILTGVKATEKDAGSEEALVASQHDSHEGIAPAAASHTLKSGSEHTIRDDGSTNKYSQKLSTSKP
jgi:hypothetical protein